ncbi:hypothetical protein Taro_020320 [Colocasia esculenta]|uniref:RIN4 pathogenic type III effector avirulence factor Avr cleavage site domain-containing protein n=1 Tax=Colocasia esculenta TaxID=4460 RepID=A0A843UW23_COLES|nr:hypothetical protein [Colocasia esculenta]
MQGEDLLNIADATTVDDSDVTPSLSELSQRQSAGDDSSNHSSPSGTGGSGGGGGGVGVGVGSGGGGSSMRFSLEYVNFWTCNMPCLQQDKGRPLPKFGEWDVNDPATAESFTVIFNKARDEKKAGGNAQSPSQLTKQDVPTYKTGVCAAKPAVKKVVVLYTSEPCTVLKDAVA